MRSISTAGVPLSSSCSMMHSASVVLPEPDPPSTAAWRFSTSLLSVMLLFERNARPARMLLAPSPASSSSSESGMSSFGSADAAARVPPGPIGGAAPSGDGRRQLGGGPGRPRARAASAGSAARPALARTQAAAEQIEAQQLDQRKQLGQQLGALEPVRRSRDRAGAARRTRAPSSCAPSPGSAPAATGPPSPGTCGTPAPSGFSCSAESRWRAA